MNPYFKAAKLIERYGWVQGWDGNLERGFCLVGACFAAGANIPKLRDISGMGKLTLWNDSRKRTAEDVIDLLVAAACGDFT